jgi:LPS sulfotransferase NodH
MAEKNFVIFGQGRSGSNLLRSLLNSHPLVYCDIELFNPKTYQTEKPLSRLLMKTFPLWYIQNAMKKHPDKIYGFKLFFWHVTDAGLLITRLYKKGWKIIHIRRKSVLKQAFSAEIGKLTKQYHRTNDTPLPAETYHINPERIAAGISRRVSMMQKEIELVSKIEHLQVVYEEDLQDEKKWNKTTGNLFQYLGIEPFEVKSYLLITDPRPDTERIENFDEIIEYLNKNGFDEIVENYFHWL